MQIVKWIFKYLLIGALILPLTGCDLLNAGHKTPASLQTATHQIDESSNQTGTAAEPNSSQSDNSKKVEAHKNPPKPPIISKGNHSNTALYLNEALAELHYLPVTFMPSLNDSSQTITGAFAKSALREQPLPGKFTWKYPSIAPTLQSGWSASTFTTLTQGALMTYQHNRGLTIDGIAGPQVWASLAEDLKAGKINLRGYMYITVEKRLPQTLKVWKDGKVIYSSLANTGITQAPSDNGTWPIYLRYTSQTMQGVDPSGHHYYDPGVPYVSYYHGGEAVHGFWRNSYGTPQSLGCVELPIQNSKTVFNLVTYGTLVTVCNQLPKS